MKQMEELRQKVTQEEMDFAREALKPKPKKKKPPKKEQAVPAGT